MPEMIEEMTKNLKETILEIMNEFKYELREKNQQLAGLEQELHTQQQLTIQANERIRQLEQRDKHLFKIG